MLPLKRTDLDRLQRIERAMLHWMYTIKPTDNISTQELSLRLYIDDLDVALRWKHLRWFGHVHRSESWTGRVHFLHVDGRKALGRPQKSWWEVLREDVQLSGLTPEGANNQVGHATSNPWFVVQWIADLIMDSE